MPYSVSNPPQVVAQGVDNSLGPKMWTYATADVEATIKAAGYITNGGNLGMKVGDWVLITITSTGNISSYRVVTVSATAPGAVDLSDGTVIGSASNT